MNKNDDILIHQKRLPMGFFAAWMMVIMTVMWVQLDMYLPALPTIREEFGVSEAYLNITINVGLVMIAVGTLIGGVLSDALGRKALLIGGLILSAVCTFAASFAHGVMFITVMRAVGSFGTGTVLAILMAIVKDSFEGARFNRVMTVLQAVAAVGPVLGPSLGALIINFFSWRYIFVFLGSASAVCALPMFLMTETWGPEKRVAADFKQVFAGAGEIIRDRGFVLFMGVMSFVTIPMWAYIGVSSYVFINEFGRTNTAYGIYYAVSVCMTLLGPFIYMTLDRFMRKARIVTLGVLLTAGGGTATMLFGRSGPLIFLICIIPIMITEAMIRPLGMIVLLEENPDRAGTVSSWSQFIINLVGIVGTSLATLSWTSMAFGVGVISLSCAVLAALCWIALLRGRYMGAFRSS